MGVAGHYSSVLGRVLLFLVAHMGQRRNNSEVWSENVKEKDHLESLGINMRIILKWIKL
jgi:hypothetical protein